MRRQLRHGRSGVWQGVSARGSGDPLFCSGLATFVEPDPVTFRGRNLPSRFRQPAETPWWGLGRFVFAQRVSGFRAVGPGSVPAKRQIYPSRVRPRGVIEPIEMEIRPAGQPEGPPGCHQGLSSLSRTQRRDHRRGRLPAPPQQLVRHAAPGATVSHSPLNKHEQKQRPRVFTGVRHGTDRMPRVQAGGFRSR